jgi:hypothetical protein
MRSKSLWRKLTLSCFYRLLLLRRRLDALIGHCLVCKVFWPDLVGFLGPSSLVRGEAWSRRGRDHRPFAGEKATTCATLVGRGERRPGQLHGGGERISADACDPQREQGELGRTDPGYVRKGRGEAAARTRRGRLGQGDGEGVEAKDEAMAFFSRVARHCFPKVAGAVFFSQRGLNYLSSMAMYRAESLQTRLAVSVSPPDAQTPCKLCLALPCSPSFLYPGSIPVPHPRISSIDQLKTCNRDSVRIFIELPVRVGARTSVTSVTSGLSWPI